MEHVFSEAAGARRPRNKWMPKVEGEWIAWEYAELQDWAAYTTIRICKKNLHNLK